MRYILYIIATFFSLTAMAQVDNDRSNVGFGRETSRMPLAPYSTAEEAFAAAGEIEKSKYIRPVEEWMSEETDGYAIFRSEFAYPFSWINRLVHIHVGAVGGAYDIYINNKYAGSATNGFSPAEFNITKIVKEDINTIEIRIPKEHWSQSLECFADKGDVSPLDVYILSQPTIRLRDIMHDARIDATGKMANVELGLVVKTESLNAKKARIYYELVAADTTLIEQGYRDVTLRMRGEDTVKFMARIPTTTLWSSQSPTLHRLNAKTQIDGRYAEYHSYPIAFSELSHSTQGVAINGTDVELKFGTIDATTATAEELRQLKAQGKNAVRVGEGVTPAAFYRLCEQEGIYVVVTIPINTSGSGESRKVGGNPSNDPTWSEAYLDRAEAAYRSTSDFGCVVGYELAGESANGINLYDSYLLLKSLEDRRPISYESGGGEWNNDIRK